MRCASKAAESGPHVSVRTPKQKLSATDASSVAEATPALSRRDAAAGHERTLMSSLSTSSVSHALLIRKTDPSTAIESSRLPKRGMDDALRRIIFGSSDESR
uniref:Uncharacterized protein n=1 Tax=Peronospora matthiolae TaxID=2874970 RepID=A0AAV1TBE9_9STRA